MLPNDKAATQVKDTDLARKGDGRGKGWEAVPDEHEPTRLFEAIDNATDAVRTDVATDAVCAHDATLAGEPNEATDPVNVQYVTSAVGGVWVHRPKAGSVSGDPTKVVCCAQTEDVTQVPGDIGDDDVTHIMILLETRTVPAWWTPAECGTNNNAMGCNRGHGKGRNKYDVNVTNDTGVTRVLVVGTDEASKDEANAAGLAELPGSIGGQRC